jgi:hypothetical protein
MKEITLLLLVNTYATSRFIEQTNMKLGNICK